MELQMTIKYVRALLSLEFEDEDNSVRQSDIGVVTPYVRQVSRLTYLDVYLRLAFLHNKNIL